MDIKEIQNLIKFVAKSGASEVKLEMEDVKITIKTGSEKTETTFDDLYEQFESEIAVLVSSISKDMTLTRKKREKAYSIQLKESSFSAKLIKLCDISANLGELKNSKASKSKKLRLVKQQRHYLSIMKNDILGNPNYPYVQSLIESANVIFIKFGQRPISVQLKS